MKMYKLTAGFVLACLVGVPTLVSASPDDSGVQCLNAAIDSIAGQKSSGALKTAFAATAQSCSQDRACRQLCKKDARDCKAMAQAPKCDELCKEATKARKEKKKGDCVRECKKIRSAEKNECKRGKAACLSSCKAQRKAGQDCRKATRSLFALLKKNQIKKSSMQKLKAACEAGAADGGAGTDQASGKTEQGGEARGKKKRRGRSRMQNVVDKAKKGKLKRKKKQGQSGEGAGNDAATNQPNNAKQPNRGPNKPGGVGNKARQAPKKRTRNKGGKKKKKKKKKKRN